MQQRAAAPFIPFIHLLRGVAPLLVVWPHLSGLWLYTYNQHWSVWQFFVDAIQLPLHLKDGSGHLGVVIFFLISGFIISHVCQQESRLEFAVKRLFRIFPPLALATALMYIAARWSEAYGYGRIIGNTATTAWEYVLSATLLNYPLLSKPLALSLGWSLYAEVIFYAIVFSIIPLMKRDPLRSTVAITGVALLVVLPMRISDFFSYHVYFTAYLPLFIIGRIFYLEFTNALSSRATWILAAGNFFLLCLTYTNKWPGEFTKGPTEPVVNYLLGILIFYLAMRARITVVPRLLMFSAEISYSLYLVHLPIGMLILNAAHAHGVPFGIGFLGALAASLVGATLSHRLVELPSQRLARRLLTTLRRGAAVPQRGQEPIQAAS